MTISRYITWMIVTVGACAIGLVLSIVFHFKYAQLFPLVGLVAVVGIWAYATRGVREE